MTTVPDPPLAPTAPALLPFLVAVSEAVSEEWGLSVEINPHKLRSAIPALRSAITALDAPLYLHISPTRPSEIWLQKLDKTAGQPGAAGPLLFPPLPLPGRKAAA